MVFLVQIYPPPRGFEKEYEDVGKEKRGDFEQPTVRAMRIRR